METDKPPLGVNPHWYVYPRRIIVLLEAALRYANFSLQHTSVRAVSGDYRMISQWAKEVSALADLMVELEDGKNAGG